MTAENRKIWLNRPQKLSALTNAQEEYGIWGRATGKTDGPIARRTSQQATAMPRGTTAVVAATYMQHLDRTLPPLFKSWDALGFKKDVHYWVRERPPRRLDIPEAIYKVLQFEHYITWYNGHVFYLVSQDREGLANAKSLDAVVADEAKFLNHEKYVSDVVPANRGNDNIFGHMAEHHAVTMFTDMPTKQQAKWILEKAKQVDKTKIMQVINLQIEYNKMYLQVQDPLTSEATRRYLKRKMVNYYIALNELRKGLVWYYEASTLENIQILGPEKFKQWERELPQRVYDTAILNLKNISIPNGFFHLLDMQRHTYNAQFDYSYIDSLGLYLPEGVVKDCRVDSDIIKTQALEIAFDYNSAIKSLVIGQRLPGKFRTLKSMYVLGEEKKTLYDLVDEFCDYYAYHPGKRVIYYYDHTALITDSLRLDGLKDVVIKRLRARGWNVTVRFIGQAGGHDTRYRLWENVFQERDPRYLPAEFNAENCEQVLISMQQTGVQKSGGKFRKIKTTERATSNVRPQDAPHLGDAWETLYIGSCRTNYASTDEVPEMIFG